MTTGPPAPIASRRLHPMTLLQRVVVSLPALAVLLMPVVRNPDANAWFSLLMAALYGFVVVPMLVLQYYRFRYTITPKEITIRSGALTRQHRVIPIDRIQNIEIEQTLLPRLFGTAKVKIETAGGTTTEGVLEYVGLQEAYHIREVVRAYQRQSAPAAPERSPEKTTETATETVGETTPETAAEFAPAAPSAAARAPGGEAGATPVFTMPLAHVVLSGVFRFSLLYIALIFSAMEYAGVDPEEIVDYVTRGQFGWLADAAAASPGWAVFVTAVTVALFAWGTGIVVNVNRYYNFRLWFEDDKLHRRHGLLTLAEGTIPLKKVQALVLRTNPLMRAFGWYALEAQTMGLDARQQGHQVVVPFARLPDVLAVARRIRPFELPGAFAAVSRRTIRRGFVRYTLRLLAVVLPLAWFWRPALWALAAVPLLLYLSVLQYRRHGYAFDGERLFVRRGVFQPRLWITPVDRFQVFYLSASVFQRRLGLRSLNVDTAGAGALRYPVIVDLPADEAEARLAEWSARFRERSSAGGG